MPMQIYGLVFEAIQGSLQNAPIQTQIDAMNCINDRARVIYTQAYSVEFNDNGKI